MATLAITISQLIVCVLFGASSINGKPPSAILNGAEADENEFPYQVSISMWHNPSCTGAIIGPRHILTAAHCFNQKGINFIDITEVTTATNNIENGQGKNYPIKSIKTHPRFDFSQNLINDIAVITLKTEIKFNNREKAVKLPTSDTPGDLVAVASGWGDTTYPKGHAPAMLQKLSMKTILNGKCSVPTGLVHDTQLCAFAKIGAGLCNGDSGGPLVHDGIIIGITSFGIDCGIGYPDIFTRVYKYVDWINEVIESS